MVKKLVTGATTLALFAMTAAPALAWGGWWSKPTVTNTATVVQTGTANANTGYNTQTGGWGWWSQPNLGMTTGIASAGTIIGVSVDQGCGCVLGAKKVTNTATVVQTGTANANTGYNVQSGKGTLWMATGDADAGVVIGAEVIQ